MAKELAPRRAAEPAAPAEPILSEHDVYLLAEGTYRRSYERLGSHPMTLRGQMGVHFAVWAPNAARVSVIGAHNDWDPRRADAMFRRGESGIWECFVPGLGPGAAYKYHLESRFDGYVVDKADPYAFLAERAPGTASIIYELFGYEWGDDVWLAERPQRQSHGRPLSIYELHAGSWRRVPEEGDRSLTYRELAHALVPYVKDLGFTHVELMPLTEYPADQSWGYQTAGYFAATSRYGNPHDLMYFVDYCHQHGVGVLLDWVPAHFAKEEHGLGFFDGTHLYEHADPVLGEHPVWGTYIFNYGRAEVRNFLLSSARFWLEQYHVDGFRVDAVASMVWLDHARPESHWGTNRLGGRENLDAVAFLRAFNDLVHEEYAGAITVAEESTSYTWVTRSGEGARGEAQRPNSLGFDYKWNLGWMHDTLDYFEADPVMRAGLHDRLTFPIWYAFNERYVLPFSHDEVVHLKKALLTKMPGDDWQRFANLRALLAYMFAHPGKKLLFMGAEIGQWQEWSEARSLDWHLLTEGGSGGIMAPLHQGVQRCLADLNRLYDREPAMHALDSLPRGFEWIDHRSAQESVIAFLRRGAEPGQVIVVACNFTPVVRDRFPVGVPIPGEWHEALNTDAPAYGGSGVLNQGRLWAEAGADPRRDAHGALRFGQSLTLSLPPLGVAFFKPGAGPAES